MKWLLRSYKAPIEFLSWKNIHYLIYWLVVRLSLLGALVSIKNLFFKWSELAFSQNKLLFNLNIWLYSFVLKVN